MFLVLLGLFLIIGCKEKTTGPGQVFEPSDNAVTLSDNDLLKIITYNEDGTLVFDQASAIVQNLTANQILIGGVTTHTPHGFLRKITGVNHQNNQTTVTTQQASLPEAYNNLTFKLTHSITPDDIARVEYPLKGVRYIPGEGKNPYLSFAINDVQIYNNVLLNGSIEIEPSFEFEVDLRMGSIRKVHFGVNVEKRTSLSITAQAQILDIENEVVVAQIYCNPIAIGSVIVVPYLKVDVGGSVTAAAQVTTNLSTTETLTAGITYNNGKWTKYGNVSKSFNYTPFTVNYNVNAKAWTGPDLSMLVYGIFGPWVDLNAFLELDVNTSEMPWWVLEGGIETNMGCRAVIFGNVIFEHTEPLVISVSQVVAQATDEISGSLQGTVRNAVNSSALADVTVKIFKTTSRTDPDYTTTTNANGGFSIDIPAGYTYRVVFSKTGFIDATYLYVTVPGFGTRILDPVLQIDDDYTGYGDISGYINNALTNAGVADVTLQLRSGINNTTGTPLVSTTTGSTGAYSFGNVFSGNYTILASKADYISTAFNVICLGGQNTPNQNGVISPILDSSELRIVLTWGAVPSDLDSHLTGPIPDSESRFHVYYAGRTFYHQGELYVELDRDDVDSYGPETTTLYHQSPGMYRFSVHDYTNRYNYNSLQLSNSSAQVRVWRGNEMMASFNVPTETIGNVWRVFEIYGNQIIPINLVSNATDYKSAAEIDYSTLKDK